MDNELFTSSDLSLVSTLSLTFKIENIDKTDPKKVVFSFKKSKELDKTIKSYQDKKLKVQPLDFYNQIRAVKTMIYERKQRAKPAEDTQKSSNSN